MTTKTLKIENLKISIFFISEVQGEIDLKDTVSGATEYYSWSAFQKASNGKLVTCIAGGSKSEMITKSVEKKISKAVEKQWEKMVNGLSDNFDKKTESLKSIAVKLITEYNDLDNKVRLSYIELASAKDSEVPQLKEHIDALQIQKDTILELAPVLGISADEWSYVDHELTYNV